MSSCVELRIHGVSGTSPEQMLDTKVTHCVAGDEDAGFWRSSLPSDETRAPGLPETLEGYRWGGLTSRSIVSAFWVLLAPFALINLAAAMHDPKDTPVRERKGIARGYEGAAVRLFALTLTLVLTAAAYIATVDLGAWQCGSSTACTEQNRVSRVVSFSWFHSSQQRIAIALVAPIAVVALLWYLARKTWQRYEVFPPGPANAQRVLTTPFDDPEFWNGRERTEILRLVHIAAAFAMLAALVSYASFVMTDGQRWSAGVAMVAALVVLLGSVVLTAAKPQRRLRGVSWTLLVASILALAFAAASVGGGPALTSGDHPTLPGVDVTLVALLATQLLLALVLLARSGRVDSGVARCRTASIAILALVVGGAFSAGVTLRLADFLAVPTSSSSSQPVAIVVPATLGLAAYAAAIGAVAVLVCLLVAAPFVMKAIKRQRKDTPEPALGRTWAVDSQDREARELVGGQRRHSLARALTLARAPDQSGVLLLLVAIPAAATSVAILVLSLVRHGRPINTSGHGWSAATAGSWLIVGFAFLLVAIAARSRSNEALRRHVGVLWDIATFWPRTAHPLAPPCYAERAVPEFAARAMFFRYGDPDQSSGAPSGSVVISAHSQGTVIAAAALLRCDSADGVAFLSYGSPLNRLYRQYFPAYFSASVLETLYQRLDGRWINLYRPTDPIGGPVEIPNASVDVEVPVRLERAEGDTVYPPIEGHSNYPREPSYPEQLAHLTTRLSGIAVAAGD